MSLLFPFVWQGAYIPVMPFNMKDVLEVGSVTSYRVVSCHGHAFSMTSRPAGGRDERVPQESACIYFSAFEFCRFVGKGRLFVCRGGKALLLSYTYGEPAQTLLSRSHHTDMFVFVINVPVYPACTDDSWHIQYFGLKNTRFLSTV